MPGKAAKVTITERQQVILEEIRKSRTTAVLLVQRATIILLAFQRMSNEQITAEVGLSCKQVGVWRRRWAQSWNALIDVECSHDGTMSELRRAIEDILSDAYRSGRPSTYSAAKIAEIVAIAREAPQRYGVPFTLWTYIALRDVLIEQNIVPFISVSWLRKVLNEAGVFPHRVKYWVNTKERDPEVFQRQVEAVCNAYFEAPELYLQCNTHTVCLDEMTSIQALEQIADPIPSGLGHENRLEHEYRRHGTACLIGSWHVVLGQMIAPSIGPTRTEADFLRHIELTMATACRNTFWVFICDRLNTHCSESLVRLVANRECIPDEELGKKGVSGVLKSMASRIAFLSDPAHKIRFVFLPKHSSWLNQIEVIFGIINRRALRHGSFKSQAELRERLLDFIEYYNRTTAKPFRWTYTGRRIATAPDRRPRTWKQDRELRRQLEALKALTQAE